VSATERLLDFAAAPHALPPGVRADTLRLLRDTLGCGWAGSTAPGADGVFAAASGWSTGGDCRVLGRGARLPAPAAAFVNGFQIHCLEWDAVHEPAVVHALSVVVAAVMAAIDRQGAIDIEDALAAIAVGVDIASGLGLSATSGLKFFRPATAGLIGATLACGRIAGLPRDACADLLGLAYGQCAGTMQAHVEGSIALPLQIAHAARAAVTALDLVRNGLTGPHDVFEGPFGYFTLFEDGSLADYVAGLGEVWRIAEVSTKPYPSGRASHGALAAIQQARAELGFLPDDVDHIIVAAPPLIHRLVGREWDAAMTPAKARLCLTFLAALMIVDGRIDPRRFVESNFANSALRALGARLRLVADANEDPNALFPQEVTIVLADGRRRTMAVPATLGSPANPLSLDQLAAKWALCAELGLTPMPARLDDNPADYFARPNA
jgi:2-methylcitrate dehydratase PrpD